jgi:hypothetical protein
LRTQRRVPHPTRYFTGVDGWGESDVDEIVELLEKLYVDRDLAGQRATVGATAMARLTWHNQVAALVDVIGSLA